MTTKRVVLFPKIKYTQLLFLTQELKTTRSYVTHFLTNERSSHAGCKYQGGNTVISDVQFVSALFTLRDRQHNPGKWQMYKLGMNTEKLL